VGHATWALLHGRTGIARLRKREQKSSDANQAHQEQCGNIEYLTD
jgi:hypothetical protein